MSIIDGLLSWLLRNVRISRDILIRYIEDMDANKDGMISGQEVVDFILEAWHGKSR